MTKNTGARTSNAFTRDDAIAFLTQIVLDEKNDAADRAYAVEILAKMEGWNAPATLELGLVDYKALIEKLLAQHVDEVGAAH